MGLTAILYVEFSDRPAQAGNRPPRFAKTIGGQHVRGNDDADQQHEQQGAQAERESTTTGCWFTHGDSRDAAVGELRQPVRAWRRGGSVSRLTPAARPGASFGEGR